MSDSLMQGYVLDSNDHPVRPCGAIPSPRHVLSAARSFEVGFEAPPAWWWIPKKLSYWLNNVDGDCVTAESAFSKACTNIFISDDVVKTWATSHGVMNGAVISDVLDWMAEAGFEQDGNTYNEGAKQVIDYTNDTALRAAIAKGPVKIGVAAGQLQRAVGSRNGWFAPAFRVDHNYNHCVSLCGYGTTTELAKALGVTVPQGIDPTAQGYLMFTWDTIGVIGPNSLKNICCEAWLRSPTTVTLGTNPPTPDVVVTPVPNPTPVPPVPPVGNYWKKTVGTDGSETFTPVQGA